MLAYPEKLFAPLLEHLVILGVTLFFSLVLAILLTVLSLYSSRTGKVLTSLLSMVYAIPSLALFALMIPLTGLGKTTAIIVLVVYNQYLLLRNFLAGLEGVDPALIEAARGMGMSTLQILLTVQLPLAKGILFAGIRLAIVSTIGIATIAALINAGGLGTLLFDGLRTDNMIKVVWGSLLAGGLAILADQGLRRVEKRLENTGEPPATKNHQPL